MAARSILVVDDEIELANALATGLRREGYTVSTAGSLAEAFDAVARRAPRLIILDVLLPDGVGLSLLRTLATFQLPRFRGPGGVEVPTHAGAARRLRDAMQPFFVLPLVGWSMVFGTHIVLNAFQGLLWMEQGFGADIIGALLAAGSGALTAANLLGHGIARVHDQSSLSATRAPNSTNK